MPYRMTVDVTDEEYAAMQKAVPLEWTAHKKAKDVYNKMVASAVVFSAPKSEAPAPAKPLTDAQKKAEQIMRATRGVAGAS